MRKNGVDYTEVQKLLDQGMIDREVAVVIGCSVAAIRKHRIEARKLKQEKHSRCKCNHNAKLVTKYTEDDVSYYIQCPHCGFKTSERTSEQFAWNNWEREFK